MKIISFIYFIQWEKVLISKIEPSSVFKMIMNIYRKDVSALEGDESLTEWLREGNLQLLEPASAQMPLAPSYSTPLLHQTTRVFTAPHSGSVETGRLLGGLTSATT